MRTDLEDLLARDLDTRADSGTPIDPAALLGGTYVRARRVRTRRRLATAVVAVVAIAAVGAGALAVTRTHQEPIPPAATPYPASSAEAAEVLTNMNLLMPVDGVPGASARPDLVGTDPHVVHFGFGALVGHSDMLALTSGPGWEWVTYTSDRDAALSVLLTKNPDKAPEGAKLYMPADTSWTVSDPQRLSDGTTVKVRINQHPRVITGNPAMKAADAAKLSQFSLLWQPADGIWAKAYGFGTSVQDLMPAIAKLRFDTTTRCGQPFTVTPPAGAALSECSIQLTTSHRFESHPGTGFFASGYLVYGTATRTIEVTAVNGRGSSPFHASTGEGLESYAVGFDEIEMVAARYTNDVTSRQLIDMTKSIRPVSDTDDPRTYQ